MNLSKLQSEAVKEFNRLEMDDGDGCAVCLGEMMSLVNLKLLKDFLTDQIQKAYSKGREEVLNKIHGFVCDMATSEQSKSLSKEDCLELIRYQIERIYGKKLLSIQSKGK